MALDIDVSRRVGPRDIAVRIQSVAGITALFGPSGVGKTTVLNMIAGLIRPDRGHIQVGDTILFDREQSIDLPPHRRDCGYVFQDNRLFPHLRVRANLLYGRRDACLIAGPPHCLAARPSGSPSVGRCCPIPDCCCLMNRCPRSMARERRSCSHSSSKFTDKPRSRSSMSVMTNGNSRR
jgi:ABC-type molybdate transport system ATPase subunit